jgi:hypothetical protein
MFRCASLTESTCIAGMAVKLHASTSERNADQWSASYSHFTPGTHGTRGRVCPKSVLDVKNLKKLIWICWELNRSREVRSWALYQLPHHSSFSILFLLKCFFVLLYCPISFTVSCYESNAVLMGTRTCHFLIQIGYWSSCTIDRFTVAAPKEVFVTQIQHLTRSEQ